MTRQLQAFEKSLKSNRFQCLYGGARCRGFVYLDWDVECGEFGEKLSSWPIFTGCRHATDEKRLYEAGDQVGDLGHYVLGQSKERKRLLAELKRINARPKKQVL